MERKYQLGNNNELGKRKRLLARLVTALAEPDMRPWFLADEATVYEVSMDMPEEIIEKIGREYAVEVSVEQLSLPLWRLLDFLDNRAGSAKK